MANQKKIKLIFYFLVISFSGCKFYKSLSQPVTPDLQTTQILNKLKSVEDITPDELNNLLYNNIEVKIIDVRMEKFYENEHIKGAVSIPVWDVVRRKEEIPKDKIVVFYCGGSGCPLSKKAVMSMKSLGYTNVYHLEGGIDFWRAKGYPTQKR